MVANADFVDTTLTIDFKSVPLTDDNFYQLCADNPNLRIEISAEGELVIMPPAFGETGERNFDLIVQLRIWNRQAKLGRAFDSSTGYILPDKSKFSPDVSWIENSRLVGISLNQFIPIAPDFVIELRSRSVPFGKSNSDRLSALQKKMQIYQANGVRLGWLINPQERQVEIYRLGRSMELLASPIVLAGEDVLVGFSLDLTTIW
jgi:Uma2 family endonuclease